MLTIPLYLLVSFAAVFRVVTQRCVTELMAAMETNYPPLRLPSGPPIPRERLEVRACALFILLLLQAILHILELEDVFKDRLPSTWRQQSYKKFLGSCPGNQFA